MKAYNKAINTGLKLWAKNAFSCRFSSVCFFKTDSFRERDPFARQRKGTFNSKTEMKLFPFHNVLVPVFPQEDVCFSLCQQISCLFFLKT